MKQKNKCYDLTVNKMGLVTDLLAGLSIGAATVGLMYASPMKSQLFINEVYSGKEYCSIAAKQKFKCSVYRNQELIAQTER